MSDSSRPDSAAAAGASLPDAVPGGYRHDISACLAETVGQVGLDGATLERMLTATDAALGRLRRTYAEGALPFLRLAEQRDDLPDLAAIARRYRESFDDVLILGTGGSSLGSSALYEMAGGGEQAPRLHIITNVDPFVFERLVQRLDLARTGLVVISKSGGTTETVMQFLNVLAHLRRVVGDENLSDRITFITEPGDRPMRRLAERFDIPVLDHDPNVGGRYSVLSLVGMLPTLIAGLDPTAVRAGAQTVLEHALGDVPAAEIAPALGAAVCVGLEHERGINASVMLAYSDRLGSLARWYRQLWAESLGKQGRGTTPIYGTGPVDQHSQLQLWLDGPADKMFTVLGGSNEGEGTPLDPALADDPDLAYMSGRTLGELMYASRRATEETLVARGRPVRRIEMARIDESAMGALMMHFMLETVLAADVMGVDPFDQPAVETGKRLIRGYLSDMGAP